jgi:hypothetical protein
VVTLTDGLLHAESTTSALTFSSGTLGATRSLVAMFDGVTVTNDSGRFLSFSGIRDARITVGAAVDNTINNLISLATTSATAAAPNLLLGGPLVYSRFATLHSGNPGLNTASAVLVADGALLELMAAAPLLHFDVGTTLTSAGLLVNLRRSPSSSSPSTLFLGDGSLLLASGTAADPVTITNASNVAVGGGVCCPGIYVSQGGFLAATSATSALIELHHTGWTTASSWFAVEDACTGCSDTFNATTLPSSVVLAGGLLDAHDSAISSTFAGLLVRRASLTAGSGTNPVFDIHSTTNRAYTFGGMIPPGFSGGGAPGFGTLLTVSACVPGGTCSGTAGVLGDASMIVGGGTLLRATATAGSRTTFSTTGDFIRIVDGALFANTLAQTLIVSTNSTFTVGSALATFPHVHFFLTQGYGGAATTAAAHTVLNGALLASTNDIFNVGAGFLETSGGIAGRVPISFLRSSSAPPLMTFDGSTVSLGLGGVGTGNLIDVRANTSMFTGGAIASIAGTGTTAPWTLDRLVIAQCGLGAACTPGSSNPGLETGSAAAAFALNGGFSGPHAFRMEMFGLSGTNTSVDTDPAAPAGLPLGTDQPFRHGGVALQATNTSINSQGPVFKVDTALVAASASIIAMVNSTMSVGTSAATPHAIDLTQRAKMTVTVPLDAAIRLSSSTLTVANGHAVNVAGGSFLKITGDLFSLAGGSTLIISNGAGLNIAGGSSASIGGALINFIGAGNVVNVSNNICGAACPTLNVGGTSIPYFLTGGATLANLSLGPNTIKGVGTVTYSGPSAAAVVLNGATSKLTAGQLPQ